MVSAPLSSWTKLKEKINESEGNDRMADRTRGEERRGEERKESESESRESRVPWVS